MTRRPRPTLYLAGVTLCGQAEPTPAALAALAAALLKPWPGDQRRAQERAK